MPNYVRARIAGGSYFFTVALLNRRSDLLIARIDLLRDAIRKVKSAKPFYIDACVILPDHMHCVWTLPIGDHDYSSRWKDIKGTFSRALPKTELLDEVRKKMVNGESGNAGFGNMRFATTQIIGDILITSTSIHTNMDW